MEIIGPLQLRIMTFIWEEGDCIVKDVHKALNLQKDTPQLAYTTILTVMRNLVRRHMLTQMRTGRSHTFSSTITEVEHKKLIVKKMCDEFFDGDAREMIELLQKEKNAAIQ